MTCALTVRKPDSVDISSGSDSACLKLLGTAYGHYMSRVQHRAHGVEGDLSDGDRGVTESPKFVSERAPRVFTANLPFCSRDGTNYLLFESFLVSHSVSIELVPQSITQSLTRALHKSKFLWVLLES